MHKEYALVYSINGVLNAKVWEHLPEYERRFHNKLTVYVEHESNYVDSALRGVWDKPPQWDMRGTDCFATAAECIDVVRNDRVTAQHITAEEAHFTPVNVYYDYHFTRTTDEITVTRIPFTCIKECVVDDEDVQLDDVIYEYTLPECNTPLSLLYMDSINGIGNHEPKILRPIMMPYGPEHWKEEQAQCMPMEHIVETRYDSRDGEWIQIRNSYYDPDSGMYFYDTMFNPAEDY